MERRDEEIARTRLRIEELERRSRELARRGQQLGGRETPDGSCEDYAERAADHAEQARVNAASAHARALEAYLNSAAAHEAAAARHEQLAACGFGDADEHRVLRDAGTDGAPGPPAHRLTAVNRRGKTVDLQVAASPMRTEEGAISGVILVIDQRPPEPAPA